MENVASCVYMVPKLFEALDAKNSQALESIAMEISELEHAADLTKNDIRNHLPTSLFLAIDREDLLEILSIQDSIADKSEDIAVLTTLKPLTILDAFKETFLAFLEKNIETFNGAQLIINELHELLESSFGGIEAEKVRKMVDDVSFKEHEADLIQYQLLKKVFEVENEMSYATFYLWQRIFEAISGISNLSENLANRVRMTLEIK
jgi:predicted phosphate transport protein (TIGR00153 family)